MKIKCQVPNMTVYKYIFHRITEKVQNPVWKTRETVRDPSADSGGQVAYTHPKVTKPKWLAKTG